jgi:hypothetical protein
MKHKADFTITKKHLTVYWDGSRHGYYTELTAANFGVPGFAVSTPEGLYHFLRQIGDKGWGWGHPSVPALIRAMSLRFKWGPQDTSRLLNHGRFSYCDRNGEGGNQYYEDALASITETTIQRSISNE